MLAAATPSTSLTLACCALGAQGVQVMALTDKNELVDIPAAPKNIPAVVAFEEALPLRATHPRPFTAGRKLARILPSLLRDSLPTPFTTTPLASLFHPQSAEANRFTSFSFPSDVLDNYCQQGRAQGFLVRDITPAFMGLAGLVPPGQPAIALCPTANGYVLAAVIDGKNKIRDIRQLPLATYRSQLLATLRTWLETLPAGTRIHHPPVIDIPLELAEKSTPLSGPPHLSADRLLYWGLLMQAKHKILGFAPSGQTAFTLPPLLKPLAAVLVVSVLFYGLLLYQTYTLNNTLAAHEQAVEDLFAQALPNIPIVDAKLQLTRRAQELGQTSGGAPSNGIAGNLTTLAQATQAIDTIADDITLTTSSLRLRGSVPSLTDAEALKTSLQKNFAALNIQLKAANVNPNGRVDFVIEGEAK